MAFLGYTNDGVPVFETLMDVPDFYVTDGRRFGLVQANAPASLLPGQVVAVKGPGSPFDWEIFATLIRYVLVIIALVVAYFIAQTFLFVTRGYPAQQIDNNNIVVGGCVYGRNPATGIFDVKADPKCVPQGLYDPFGPLGGVLLAGAAVIAVGAIAYIGIDIYRTQRMRRPSRR